MEPQQIHPAENTGDGISETLNLKIFSGSMPPDPPGLGCLWCAYFFLGAPVSLCSL